MSNDLGAIAVVGLVVSGTIGPAFPALLVLHVHVGVYTLLATEGLGTLFCGAVVDSEHIALASAVAGVTPVESSGDTVPAQLQVTAHQLVSHASVAAVSGRLQQPRASVRIDGSDQGNKRIVGGSRSRTVHERSNRANSGEV